MQLEEAKNKLTKASRDKFRNDAEMDMMKGLAVLFRMQRVNNEA